MIAFRGFSKSFGRQHAVVDLTLDIAAGEVVALLGPNGSGKTTSIKAAAGLIRPTSGAVLVGDPARSAADPAARRAISFLPQKVSFPDMLTGREAVRFFGALRGSSEQQIESAIHQVSLNGSSNRAVATYSGGMVQRLGLAIAVASGAPVLLLDEPTAALDPDGLEVFYRVVESHRRAERTVLFSSHQMGDVERLADRFAVLVGGRLVATLTAREMLDRLADRGLMRVDVGDRTGAALEAALEIAPGTTVQEAAIVVPGPVSMRPAVLDRLRTAGIDIRGFTTEEGRLDVLYREMVGGAR